MIPTFSLRTLLLSVMLFSIVLALIYPAVLQIREASHRTQCSNQMRQLLLGMINYESGHGHLPIGIETTPDGRSFRSWRTCIKPHLESAMQHYDPNLAWDSVKNARICDGSVVTGFDPKGGCTYSVVLDSCPHYFWCCPSDSTARMNYAVIVGNETAFPLNRPVKLGEVTDGLEDTILIVETLSGSPKWIEPRDLKFDTMSFKVNGSENGELASMHSAGVNVGFADGKCFFLTSDITVDKLKALLTISGGESITRKELLERGVLN